MNNLKGKFSYIGKFILLDKKQFSGKILILLVINMLFYYLFRYFMNLTIKKIIYEFYLKGFF